MVFLIRDLFRSNGYCKRDLTGTTALPGVRRTRTFFVMKEVRDHGLLEFRAGNTGCPSL